MKSGISETFHERMATARVVATSLNVRREQPVMRGIGLSRVVRVLALLAMLLSTVGVGGNAVLAQGEISTVVPAPDLPGVPGDIPVVGFATLNLDGGDYQWQTTSRQTLTRDDDPLTVHNGFLLSIDQSLIVLKAGAPSRPVPAGKSLPLTEGERILPVASGDTAGNIVIVEFVAIDDIGEAESPDQVLPVTLDPGTYTIALLDITNLDPNGPSPGQIIVQAAGPAFQITSRDDSTAGNEDIPLVVWLVSIFRTGDAATGADDGSGQGSGTGGDDQDGTGPGTGQGEEDDESGNGNATVEATATPADEDDDGEDEETPTATQTPAEVDASPTSTGTSSGNGDESEEGADENGADTAPVLPGVPDDIPIDSFIVLDLPAGDYQWQTTSRTSLTRTDDPITVHDGFLIAVDAPVIVLKAGAPSLPVAAGQSIVLKEGDRILPTTSGDTPAHFVIVELVAVDAVGADETPDEVLPLTLEAGSYTLALLDISGIGADGPAPGEIIAEAAGPGFGISKNEEIGADTSETPELTWLVSIFPAEEDET
jgi:hypothetical protein